MSFNGNIGELDKIAADIAAKGAAAQRITATAAKAIESVAVGSIGAGVTPYLEPWAPLVKGGQASGSIAHRLTVVTTSTKIRAKLDRVASYHQTGTSRMVARPLIPNDKAGLPETWKGALDDASEKELGK